MAKIEIFPLCIGDYCTTLQVKNLLEIALSLTVFDPEGLNAIVFKLQVISLMMEVSKKSKSSYYLSIEIDTQVTHHVVAVGKSR